MRIKKAFTLAEILIVLMVIGVIATMTVPSLMKGVNEAQFKTAYKKAFNAVTNIAAVEKIAGQLPVNNSALSVGNFFASLNNNLSVKEYVEPQATNFNNNITASENLQTNTEGGQRVRLTGVDPVMTFGPAGTGTEVTGTATRTPWIVSEDGLAYAVIPSSNAACANKLTINAQTTAQAAEQQSCVIVVVDVNGLAKGPNKLESQVTGTGVSQTAKMNQLEGDRFYIFVGSDGVAAGPKTVTVSGRLMSDIK